jgi:Ubiquinol-cytochrome C chaperone
LLLLQNQEVDTELFNIFWDNTLCRIRSLKVYELSVNKHLGTVQQYSLVHMLMYDHAYSAKLDPDQRQHHLRQVVYSQWLHPRATAQTLDNDDDVVELYYRCTADHIDRLVWYIDTQYRNIVEDCPESRFASGQVPWVDLPDFANYHDASVPDAFVPTDEPVPLHPEDVLPFPWRSNMTNRGWTYYWNPQTREATWERPLLG